MEQHIYKNVMITYEDDVWGVYEKKDYNKGKSPIDLFDTVDEAVYYASRIPRTNQNIELVIQEEIPEQFKCLFDRDGNLVGTFKKTILED